ncbi:MAG TPA: glucose dehydrogenase, partial [Pirellulales bacterium]|jgi:quinoprotein glucose dehydrogenase
MGLVGSGKSDAWLKAIHDESPAARMGVLLALRRREDPMIAEFLSDPDPRLVLEAARAINDVPITAAFANLAAVRLSSTAGLPLLRRVLNANFRLGRAEHAVVLADAVARADLPGGARTLALEMLAEWGRPSGRDKVLGLWRPIAPRLPSPAVDALRPKLTALLRSAPAAIRTAAGNTIAALAIKEAGSDLAAIAADREVPDLTRTAALTALDRLADPRRIEAAQQALLLPGHRSRTEALRVLAKVDPAAAIQPLRDRLVHGTTAEQQGAIAVLAAMPGDTPRLELAQWIDRLIAGRVPAELQLDLIEAVRGRSEPDFRKKLEQYEAARPKNDALGSYREVLSGGDAQRGLSVFKTKAAVECIRCHKLKEPGGDLVGGEVGPELSAIGTRQSRTYLLESIVDPNKQIAQGFESVVLATNDGKVHAGVLRGEDDKEIRLITVEGKPLNVPKHTIEDRKRGPSAMPGDLAQKLSKTELRDLIEFLASLKGR